MEGLSLQFLLHYTFVSPKAVPFAFFISISFLLQPSGQLCLCNGMRLSSPQKPKETQTPGGWGNEWGWGCVRGAMGG